MASSFFQPIFPICRTGAAATAVSALPSTAKLPPPSTKGDNRRTSALLWEDEEKDEDDEDDEVEGAS